jgi:hypothetical protein
MVDAVEIQPTTCRSRGNHQALNLFIINKVQWETKAISKSFRRAIRRSLRMSCVSGRRPNAVWLNRFWKPGRGQNGRRNRFIAPPALSYDRVAALRFSGALANLTIRRTRTRDLFRVAAACGDQGRARGDTHQDISSKHQHISSPRFMPLANKSDFLGGSRC